MKLFLFLMGIGLIGLGGKPMLAHAMSVQDQTAVYESYSLEASGKIQKAIEKMVGVLQKNPESYLVQYRMGWLFYLDRKYKNAVDHYKKASELSTQSIEPWLAMGLMYVNLLDYPNLISSSLEVLKRNPDQYLALQRVILGYLRMKDYSKGYEKVDRALKLYPSDPIFLEQKAYMQKEMGDLDRAKQTAMSLILLSPKNAYANGLLAPVKAN